MKALKAFIKPFEAPQRSTKIKFNLIFSLRPGLGREGLKTDYFHFGISVKLFQILQSYKSQNCNLKNQNFSIITS